MSDLSAGSSALLDEIAQLRADNARKEKMIQVLMDQVERSMNAASSEFGVFQTAVVLDGQVRHRTEALERVMEELRLAKIATEHERERAAASEARFRDLAESASDWYWETDADLRFTFVSDTFYRVTGLAPEQVLGYRRWDLVAPEVVAIDPDKWCRHRADMESHRPFRSFEYPIVTADGSEATIRITGKPCFNSSGAFVGYRGTGSDATLLVQAQKELLRSEKLAGLGGMVAGVAHEINTPVGISLTAASYLVERAQQFEELYRAGQLRRSDMESFVEASRQTASSLVTNLHRAADLVRSFKQVAVDQSSSRRRRFKLRPYLDEILLSLHPRLKRTQHQVLVSVPEEIELVCDPGALSQVVANLVINSLIHGFDGIEAGRIEISVRQAGQVGDLCLSYRDNGHGMGVDTAARMFDPFFTTRRGQGGSGLGLYLVYNLVTQTLGGHIDYTTAPGKGVHFILHIPYGEESNDYSSPTF